MSNRVSDQILSRVYLLFGAVILFALAIFGRIIMIQFFQKDKWLELADRQRVYNKEISGIRGSILSDHDEILATSQPFFKVAMDPSRIQPDGFPNFEASLDTLCINLEKKFKAEEEETADQYRNKILTAMKVRPDGSRDKHLYLVNKKVDFRDIKEMKSWPILRNPKNKGGLKPELQ